MIIRGIEVKVDQQLKESRYSRMRRLGVLIGGGNAERRAAAEQQQIIANHLDSRRGEVSGGAIATPENAEENIIKIELFFLEVLPTSLFSKMLNRWDEQHFRPTYQLANQLQPESHVMVETFDPITDVEFDIMIETFGGGFDMVQMRPRI
jgi:hypothetical protein